MIQDVLDAVAHLRRGHIVVFPTETVYGAGVDASNAAAVARLYAAKGRPAHNPLIIHVPDITAAKALAVWNADAQSLAEAFWPGALTIILPRILGCCVADNACAGLETLAVRVPDHPQAQTLLRAFGAPIAAPSANISGRLSPTSVLAVKDLFTGQADYILQDDTGCRVGLESTIVDLSDAAGWQILRHGAVRAEQIEAVLGAPSLAKRITTIKAPGMLLKHYAPTKPLRLNAVSVNVDEGLLAFGDDVPKGAAVMLNLSPAGDMDEAARHLYAYLHQLDQDVRCRSLAVMPIPDNGMGVAVRDRLMRAAQK